MRHAPERDAQAVGAGSSRGQVSASGHRFGKTPAALIDDDDRRPSLASHLDTTIEFFGLIRALLLRNIVYLANNKPTGLVDISLIMAAIVVAHTVLFFFIGRGFPGQISLLAGTLAGFSNWTCFSRCKRSAIPPGSAAAYNRSANIKWVHLFSTNLAWNVLNVSIALAAVLGAGAFCLPRSIAFPTGIANFPLIVATMTSSALIGAGIGLVMHHVEERWPFFAVADHIITWLMYFSCGIYGAYVQQPYVVAPYVALNPLLTLTEFTRHGFDTTYPTGNLNLIYPALAALVFLAGGLCFQRASGAEHAE